jgi:hypothetical protein
MSHAVFRAGLRSVNSVLCSYAPVNISAADTLLSIGLFDRVN